jgi:hypothetical protein
MMTTNKTKGIALVAIAVLAASLMIGATTTTILSLGPMNVMASIQEEEGEDEHDNSETSNNENDNRNGNSGNDPNTSDEEVANAKPTPANDRDSKDKAWVNEGCPDDSDCNISQVTCSKNEPFLSGDCKGVNVNKNAKESCEDNAPEGEKCKQLTPGRFQ